MINKIYFFQSQQWVWSCNVLSIICIYIFNFRHLNAKHLLYTCSLSFLGFYIIKQNTQHSASICVRLKKKANLWLAFHQFLNSLFTRSQKKTSVGISLQSIHVEKQCVWSYFLSPANKSSLYSLGQVMNSWIFIYHLSPYLHSSVQPITYCILASNQILKNKGNGEFYWENHATV